MLADETLETATIWRGSGRQGGYESNEVDGSVLFCFIIALDYAR
jgi:hypothetical protein